MKKIAICFFGITRSLKHTLPSIVDNIISPSRSIGIVKMYCHFFKLKTINNPRSGESIELDINEYKLLQADNVKLDEPDFFLEQEWFEKIKSFGDSFNDGHRSTKNLLNQLYSLKQSTLMAVNDGADIVIFARPDLVYHDSLLSIISEAASYRGNRVYVPCWQNWGGMNDRFAVAVGKDSILKYGSRYDQIEKFCKVTQSALHSEKLLKFAIGNDVNVMKVRHRASRMRANGEMKEEIFMHDDIMALHNKIVNIFGLRFDNVLVVNISWILQKLLYLLVKY